MRHRELVPEHPLRALSGIQKILPTPSSRIREERQAAFRQALEERQPDIIIHDGELLGAGALFPGPAGRKRLLEAFPGKLPPLSTCTTRTSAAASARLS